MLLQRNVTVVPLHEQQIDIGGGRVAFILHQLYSQLAAYDERAEHTEVLHEAVRLYYAVTIRHNAHRLPELAVAYERCYRRLLAALESLCPGYQLVQVGDWLIFRKEPSHESR